MFSNSVISFLAFKKYKYKMYCRLQNKIKKREYAIVSYVKNNLMNNYTILLKFSNTMFFNTKIERLVEML